MYICVVLLGKTKQKKQKKHSPTFSSKTGKAYPFKILFLVFEGPVINTVYDMQESQ